MILVFCELKDGQIRKPSAEALSEGRRPADAAGTKLGALFAGASCAGSADAAKYGADVSAFDGPNDLRFVATLHPERVNAG